MIYHFHLPGLWVQETRAVLQALFASTTLSAIWLVVPPRHNGVHNQQHLSVLEIPDPSTTKKSYGSASRLIWMPYSWPWLACVVSPCMLLTSYVQQDHGWCDPISTVSWDFDKNCSWKKSLNYNQTIKSNFLFTINFMMFTTNVQYICPLK